jgi:nicotinate-nucleotide pyrophosphorylase (carboxylating)
VPIEAAGNVSLENVKAYAKAGVDYVAVGALTSSAVAADLSMRIAVDAA